MREPGNELEVSCELPADVSRGVAHVRPDCKLPANVLSKREAQYSQELVLDQVSHRGGGTYPHLPHLSGRLVSVDAHLGFYRE